MAGTSEEDIAGDQEIATRRDATPVHRPKDSSYRLGFRASRSGNHNSCTPWAFSEDIRRQCGSGGADPDGMDPGVFGDPSFE